jgi:dienelactone hydrolase
MKLIVTRSIVVLVLFSACLRASEVNPSQTREAFLKIVDRPRVPLAPEVTPMALVGSFPSEHFTYASETDQRVPGILVKPAGAGPFPVVICAHGTSSKKESNQALMKALAAKGILGVAIDGRFHGERTKAGSGDVEYNEAIALAYKTGKGHPLYFDTVWDLMRLIDYLQTRSDVDPKRIGIIGFSKGGIETFLVSAMDERIAVSIPCIGMQSFKWGLENNQWRSRIGTVNKAATAAAKDEGVDIDLAFAKKFFDRLIPGIYSDFDGPIIVQVISPRPLMLINGEADDKTPLDGLKVCHEAAKKAYASKGVEDKLSIIIQEKAGHTVTETARKAAIDWFVQWLKP